jgi:hypothetical protein
MEFSLFFLVFKIIGFLNIVHRPEFKMLLYRIPDDGRNPEIPVVLDVRTISRTLQINNIPSGRQFYSIGDCNAVTLP